MQNTGAAGDALLGEWPEGLPDLGGLLDQELVVAGLALGPVDPLDQLLAQAAQPAPSSGGGGSFLTDSAGAGSGGRGSSGAQQPPAGLTAEELKKERIRAQNREKQQRFRERQREKKRQAEQQVESTAADLERERAANASLRLATATLEAVQAQKDAAVAVLEQAARDDPGPRQRLQAQQEENETIASLARQLSALTFQQRVELCGRLFRATAPALEAVQQLGAHEGGHVKDVFALGVDTQEKLGQQMAAAHPYLLEGVLGMSREMLMQDWSCFCDLAGSLADRLDRGAIGEAEATEQLRPAAFYSMVREMIFLRHRPDVIRPLLRIFRLEGESEEAATARWRRVAESMDVSREQAERMLPTYLVFLERMEQLRGQTAACRDTLQAVQQSLSERLVLSDTGLSPLASQYLDLAAAVGHLDSKEGSEVAVMLEFYSCTAAAVSEVQKLRLLAGCRPHLSPDVVTIVRETLRKHGLLPGEAAAAAAGEAAAAGRAARSGGGSDDVHVR